MRSLIMLTGFLGAMVACGVSTEAAATSGADLAAAHHAPLDADGGLTDDGGVPTTGIVNDLSIIVEPSDHGAALVAAINAATTSVHMTMYELSAADVINALLARHQAGVEVKVVLNGKFPGGENPNQDSFKQLQTAGIPVVWSSDSFSYTHEKSVVLDGKTAWIMTMNAATSSQIENREYLAVVNEPDAVAETDAQFTADFAGTSYTPDGPLLMSPVTMRPGLVSLLASATTTLDFEVEEMDDPDFINDLCAAAGRHVTVRGLLSSLPPSDDAQKALDQLKSCGVTMSSLATPYIHAKAIVVDGARAYVGSANFSTTSIDKNRELGLVTTNPTAVSTVNAALTTDIGNGKAF